MPTEIMQWIVGQVGTGGLAAFALWMLNKTWEGRLTDGKTTQAEMTEERKTLRGVLSANTVALTDLHRISQETIAASRELCQEVRDSRATTTRARKTTAKGA